MSEFIYRFEGIKIHNGWQHPLDHDLVISKVSWLDSQTDDKLTALQITKHAKPAVPGHDPYYQKPVEQPSGEYLIEDLPLAEVKARRKREINALRDQKETSGFLHNDVLFDSDMRSAQRIQVATIAANASLINQSTFSVTWRAADNSDHTLTAQDMLALTESFAAHGEAVFETAKELKRQIHEDCQTGAEVKAVEWPE